MTLGDSSETTIFFENKFLFFNYEKAQKKNLLDKARIVRVKTLRVRGLKIEAEIG
jgi:hypothetical protein